MKTKILLISKYFYPYKGGVENVVNSIINIFNEIKNFNINVLCFNHDDNNKGISNQYKRSNVFRVKPFIIFKGQPIGYNLKKIKTLIKNNDIIHHHFPNPSIELLLLFSLKLLKKKKFFITYHANPIYTRWKKFNFLYQIIYKKLFKNCDSLIFTSDYLRKFSNLDSGILSKSTIIPLTSDKLNPSLLDYKDYSNCNTFSTIQILYVGKLRKYKGLHYLLHSIKDLDVFLRIVGEGEEYKELIKLSNHLNLSDKIEFISTISDDELSNIYKKSDLFVLPSIDESEAFGIVQIEAMSYGIPIINTNLKSGVPYVSLNNHTGITVEPKDSFSLKKAIEKFISNRNLIKEYGVKAQKRVLDEFTEEAIKSRYINLYKQHK